MAFVHSKDTRVTINDKAFSGWLRNLSAANTRTVSDSTVFGDEGMRFTPGLRSGTLTLEGLFEGGDQTDELRAADGVNNALLVSGAPGGFAIGQPVATSVGDLQTHTLESSVAEVVAFTVESIPDELIDLGASLHDLTAETGDANGSSVDGTASSSNGGVGVLHVTAVSGTTPTADVTIQHSPDESTWVDLITFTQVTAATSQRVTATGTVDRYLRAIWTVGGTDPSFTFTAAFARR